MTIKRKQQLLAIFAWGTLALATSLVGLLVFWAVYPYNFVKFNNTPYPVKDKTLYQGEYLEYTVDYCKYTDIEPESVERDFVDGIIFKSIDARANIRPGCNVAKPKSIVPTTLPPGDYHLEITVTYRANPIRDITYTNKTETFTVLERK